MLGVCKSLIAILDFVKSILRVLLKVFNQAKDLKGDPKQHVWRLAKIAFQSQL
jgi:hypothetical protein